MALPFEISVEDYAALRKSEHPPLLLDVREPDEYDTAKIAGSILLPLGDVSQKITAVLPDKNAHVVVHCHHGMRSAKAAQHMIRLGYTQVQNLAGGIDEWSAKIDPSVPVY